MFQIQLDKSRRIEQGCKRGNVIQAGVSGFGKQQSNQAAGYGNNPEHYGIRDLVGSLVARLARDDTSSAVNHQ